MKNKNLTFKTFFYKYNKLFFFLILLAICIGTTVYFVNAANDDDDKFEVTNIKVSSITDGTNNVDGNMDSSDTNGNDSSANNGIVRTYDSITYTLSYILKIKAGQTASADDQRSIEVAAFFPNTVDGIIRYADSSYSLQNQGNYNYATFGITEDLPEGGEQEVGLTLSLSNISAPNNTVINPIFYIREATDSNMKSASELTNEEIAAIGNICENQINENNQCSTTVSASEDYFVNLYSAGASKNELVTTYNLGYMVGISKDSNKGIKGKYIPSSISFSLIDNKSSSETNITYSSTIDQDFSSESYSNILEKVYGSNGLNGSASISNNTITVSNIERSSISDKTNYVAFSSGAFTMTSTRQRTQIGDITFNLTTNHSNNTNSLSLYDTQTKKIGDFKSTINIDNLTTAKKVYSYGQDNVSIKVNMNYGLHGGDELNSLTSYLKIDNSAIRVLSNNNSYILDANNDNNHITPSNITYYYGEWTSDYFTLNTNIDGCPSSITTPEEIMNLFGGPCISTKSSLKTYNEIINYDGSNYTENLISEDIYRKGPLAIKITFESEDSGMKIDSGSAGLIDLTARISDNSSIINSSHQIVMNTTAQFAEESSSSLYYLTDTYNSNGINDMKNPNNYKKTIYDYTNKTVSSINEHLCKNGAEDLASCSISGNTIIVAAATTSKPELKTTYNSNDKTNFYYYPIEWIARPSVLLTNAAATTSMLDTMVVDYYLPSSLVVTNSELLSTINNDGQVGQRKDVIDYVLDEHEYTYSEINSFRDSEDTYTGNFKKYSYTIDLKEYSDIPSIKVYTNIKLDTKTSNIYGYASVNFKTNTNIVDSNSQVSTSVFETIEPISERTSGYQVTIHNDAAVTTQGSLSSSFLEKNEPYTFNMKAYNNTNSSQENVVLYYVLPNDKDSMYEDLRSKFETTDFKLKLGVLPAGYTAYYNTGGESANIITNELHPELSSDTNSWVAWADTNTEISGVTAIKIVKTGDLSAYSFFGSEEGINLQITPVNSNVGDIFYNQFYVITGTTNKKSYPSSRNKIAIYNRTISGFVWEDYDYDGIYNNDESRLENIPVSLYKISDDLENFDANDPTSFVGKEGEEWISDTTTDTNGNFSFNGLTEGRYYAKYTYDSKKYSITKRDALNTDNTPANSINSKARSFGGDSVAISSIVVFNELNNSSFDSLNLGLSIKKEFAVEINNYIKNVTITSDSGTESHDYDKAKSVTISLKNTNNKVARIKYDFVIENTKYFPGYVGLIQDIMPVGMTFNPNYKENQDWVYSGGALYYTGLSGKLLVPNEKYYFSLVLDFNITEGGSYINFVALDNLVLMGDEVPEFNFNNVDTSSTEQPTTGDGTTETNTSTNTSNTGEGQ